MSKVTAGICLLFLLEILYQCDAHAYSFGSHSRSRYGRPMSGPPRVVYRRPVYRPGRRPVYSPPVYRRPVYNRPVYNRPVPAVPAEPQAVFNLVSSLPFYFYNNYVCNVISNTWFDPSFNGSPNINFYVQQIPHVQQRSSMWTAYSIIRGVYYGLYPYYAATERSQLLKDSTTVTFQMMRSTKTYSAADVLKEVIRITLNRIGEPGDIDQTYNTMKQIRNMDVRYIRSCTSGMVQNSCGSIQGQFYCEYIKRLQMSPICSSTFFTKELWSKCCQDQPAVVGPNLQPQPVEATTTKPTTTTTEPTTTTAEATRKCGISSKNPASKYASFSNTLRQFRIVGGVNTEVCEFPWMVRLQVGNNLCSGSIIDETHVMTAGHCVTSLTPSDIEVNIGEYNYQIQEAQDQIFGVSKIDVHPAYKVTPPDSAENDIAILTLDKSLTFNDCVQPVCLPDVGDSSALDNAQCTVLGWGTTSYGGQTSPILQEVNVPTYNGQLCTTTQFPNTTPSNPNVQICAGRPAGGADSCQGDSGGPLFCPVNGQYVQYGIVSYGDGCAIAGNAGVYTDVSAVSPFIDSVTK